MARDLTRFLEPLEPQPEPGLEADDPRLAELFALAERGDHAAAADAAEALVAEGIHDIRPLSFLYYEAFREGGIAALGPLLDVVCVALGPSFEAIGPARRRREHFNKRLAWLFDTIVDALEYHQKHGTPTWDAFHEGLTPEVLRAIVRSGERVAAALAADVYANAAHGLGRLLGFLRARAEVLAAQAAPPAAQAAQAAPPAAQTAQAAPPAAQAAQAAPPSSPPASPVGVLQAPEGAPQALSGAPALALDEARAQVAPGGAPRARIELAVAHPFLELLAKLRAFEVLIDKGELEKAAIVAEDVQQIVESFDPRVHFPEVFARFSALLSEHIDALSAYFDERDSLAWKARSQYYRVDLEGFVRG